jgi:hypothetical protein
VDQFVNFVAYAPPGTALFHERNRGWTTSDYLTAQMVDALNYLVWAKSADAHSKHPKHRPQPIPRPGLIAVQQQQQRQEQPVEDKPMTVADYLQRTGLVMNLGEEG